MISNAAMPSANLLTSFAMNASLQHFSMARTLLISAHGTPQDASIARLDLQEAAVLLRFGDFSAAAAALLRATAVFTDTKEYLAAAMAVIRQAAVEEARGDAPAALALCVASLFACMHVD